MERALRHKLSGGKFQMLSESRSKAMAAVRGKGNKTTELKLRMALVREKVYGWILHPKNIAGKPDFFFPEKRVAVFVDGCFWHGCPVCGHIPKSNSEYWKEKILRNQIRDRKTNERLALDGIKVLRFWEHELKNNLHSCIIRINAERTAHA